MAAAVLAAQANNGPRGPLFTAFQAELNEYAGAQSTLFERLCAHINIAVTVKLDEMARRLDEQCTVTATLKNNVENLTHNIQGFVAEEVSAELTPSPVPLPLPPRDEIKNQSSAELHTPATAPPVTPSPVSLPLQDESKSSGDADQIIDQSSAAAAAEGPPETSPQLVTEASDPTEPPATASPSASIGVVLELVPPTDDTPAAAATHPSSSRPTAKPGPTPASRTVNTAALARWRWRSAYQRVKMANRMRAGQLSMLNVRTSKGQSLAARLDRIESWMVRLDQVVGEVNRKQAAAEEHFSHFELSVNYRFESIPSMETILGTIRTEITAVSGSAVVGNKNERPRYHFRLLVDHAHCSLYFNKVRNCTTFSRPTLIRTRGVLVIPSSARLHVCTRSLPKGDPRLCHKWPTGHCRRAA